MEMEPIDWLSQRSAGKWYIWTIIEIEWPQNKPMPTSWMTMWQPQPSPVPSVYTPLAQLYTGYTHILNVYGIQLKWKPIKANLKKAIERVANSSKAATKEHSKTSDTKSETKQTTAADWRRSLTIVSYHVDSARLNNRK